MKKFTALITAVFLTFSSVYADSQIEYSQQMSEDIQNVVLKIKQKINVASDYKNVDYNVNDSGISVTWSKDKADRYSNMINVSADNDGEIIYYRKYSADEGSGTDIVLSDDAQNNALEFIKSVNPSSYTRYKLKNTTNTVGSSRYSFYYSAYVNNIEVDFDNITVSVDKYTGEVISYQADKAKTNGIYPDTNGIVSKEAAINEYINENGIELYFSKKYKDGRPQSGREIKLAASNSSVMIDAKTGKKIVYDEDKYSNDYGKNAIASGSSEAAAEEEDALQLTEEEILEAEEVASLISPEDALSKAKTVFPIIKNEKLSGSSIVKNSLAEPLAKGQTESSYTVNVSTENSYCGIDGKTGEIKRFYYYGYDSSEDKTAEISYSEAEETAKNTLDKLNMKTPLYDDNAQRYEETKDERYYDYNFYYNQLKDGIRYIDNSISITVDAQTGYVTSYYKYWQDDDFPVISKKPTDRELFDMISEYDDFSLKYSLLNDEIKLVYAFGDASTEINALTGEKFSYYYEQDEVKAYDDISGHWAKAYIEYLSNQGFKFEGDSFEPDKELTWEDFAEFLGGSLTDEKEAYSKKSGNVTRYDMAELAADSIGEYVKESFVKNPQYFADVFSDVDESRRVYANIAVMLGFMKDQNGLFNGEQTVTRAEMTEILYYVIIRSEEW